MAETTDRIEAYLASQRRIQEIGQRCSDAIADSVAAAIPEQHSPYVLYRFFGADGVLLYVGITNDLKRRCTEHRIKSWFGEVARVDVTAFRNQERAAAMESCVIAEHSPKYNRAGGVGAVGSSPGRPAVEAKTVQVRVPLPIHDWLRTESDLHGVEVTEMVLRCIARAWEMDGLTPELQSYRPSDGPLRKAGHRS